MHNLLHINQLTIQFNHSREPVVNKINFEIEKGQTVAIVGESGSGKTLTALSILGLQPKSARITEGEVLFQSKTRGVFHLNLLNNKALGEIRGKEIGFVFQ